jgi:hypothetical protein
MPESLSLAEYYKKLLAWEGQPPRGLIDAWPAEFKLEIEQDFRKIIRDKSLKGSLCPLEPGSTNQSIGNQVEVYVFTTLGLTTEHFLLQPCRGAGYPDRALVNRKSAQKIALEVKATSDWNEKDSNRRVITSSSSKLRTQFTNPILHLMTTVLYKIVDDSARIDAVRLDFLEPMTMVNVRLEASVNHKILSTGSHTSVVI